MKNKTYKIERVSDFLRIPADQLPVALSEFVQMLPQIKAMYDIQCTISGMAPEKMFPKMEWEDDGKREIRINLVGKMKEQP